MNFITQFFSRPKPRRVDRSFKPPGPEVRKAALPPLDMPKVAWRPDSYPMEVDLSATQDVLREIRPDHPPVGFVEETFAVLFEHEEQVVMVALDRRVVGRLKPDQAARVRTLMTQIGTAQVQCGARLRGSAFVGEKDRGSIRMHIAVPVVGALMVEDGD